MTKPRTVITGLGVAAALTLSVPFIMQREGHANKPYRDVGGVLTVCYGHTGPDVDPSRTYSDFECKVLLDTDIEIVKDHVLSVTPNLQDRPSVLAATISFTYNVGTSTYDRSSVNHDFQVGQYAKGCAAMKQYVYAAGKYNHGLALRRQAEYNLCMKGV